MRKSFYELLADRGGTTVIEYAVIAFLVSIAIVAGATAIGTTLSSLYFGKLSGNL